jgi:hypothetical protein
LHDEGQVSWILSECAAGLFLATLKQAENFSDEDLLEEYSKVGLH